MYGNHNTMCGYHNIMYGNHNTMCGYHNIMYGNHNTMCGYHNIMYGNHNTMCGYHNTLILSYSHSLNPGGTRQYFRFVSLYLSYFKITTLPTYLIVILITLHSNAFSSHYISPLVRILKYKEGKLAASHVTDQLGCIV